MFKRRNRAGRVPAILTLVCAAATAFGADESAAQARQGRNQDPLFLTATNGANNFLAVINTRTKQTDYVPTGGLGGVSGNAGGVAVNDRIAAAVNFGSSNVTIFVRRGNAMEPTQVLGLTTAESFPVYGNTAAKDNDGLVQLARADKSAAQIVTFDGGVVYSEKSGSVAELNLSTNGMAGLSGPNRPVLLPNSPNNDTPFGMVARGANVYVTIAHSDLETLVSNGQIISSAAGPMPFKDGSGGFLHAPCWNTLSGQFLYSADSPGKQLLRYLVSNNSVFYDKAGVAKLGGAPTDLAAEDGLLGVIDGGDGGMSNASLFDIDSEGELSLRFAVKIAGSINGAAIIN
jgi:hypothetical protein